MLSDSGVHLGPFGAVVGVGELDHDDQEGREDAQALGEAKQTDLLQSVLEVVEWCDEPGGQTMQGKKWTHELEPPPAGADLDRVEHLNEELWAILNNVLAGCFE